MPPELFRFLNFAGGAAPIGVIRAGVGVADVAAGTDIPRNAGVAATS